MILAVAKFSFLFAILLREPRSIPLNSVLSFQDPKSTKMSSSGDEFVDENPPVDSSLPDAPTQPSSILIDPAILASENPTIDASSQNAPALPTPTPINPTLPATQRESSKKKKKGQESGCSNCKYHNHGKDCNGQSPCQLCIAHDLADDCLYVQEVDGKKCKVKIPKVYKTGDPARPAKRAKGKQQLAMDVGKVAKMVIYGVDGSKVTRFLHGKTKVEAEAITATPEAAVSEVKNPADRAKRVSALIRIYCSLP